MNINSLQFNLVQPKPQKAVSSPFGIKNQLQSDTVSFTGGEPLKSPEEKMENLVPKHKGIIYKKVKDKNGEIKKIPVEVNIVKSAFDKFNFVYKGEDVGYVRLSYIPEFRCKDEIEDWDGDDYICKNYRDEGIVGDRIEVDFVANRNKDEFCGVGHLADLLEVACCKELGFKPNVISESLTSAAPLHYKRGKRFIPYEQYCTEREIIRKELEGKNPDDMVREIVENTPDGEKYDTSSLKIAPLMYMPKNMIRDLEKELRKHPIF